MDINQRIAAILNQLGAKFRREPTARSSGPAGRPDRHTKPVEIGDGNLTIDLPRQLAVSQEEEKITVVYDPRSEYATLRFSVLYITDKDNGDAHGLAVKGLNQQARGEGNKVYRKDDKYFTVSISPSSEQPEQAEIHNWVVAMDNSMVIISLWVRCSHRMDPPVQALLDCVEPAISSLRLSALQHFKVEGKHKLEKAELSREHHELLRSDRERVSSAAKSLLGKPGLMGGESDLATMQRILDESLHRIDTQLLEGLGVVFGDMLARRLDLRWMTVTDDWGCAPALVDESSEVELIYHARDMIAKRVERGETPNLADLFNTLVQAHSNGTMKRKMQSLQN